jgi:hypothetical protein
MTYTARVKVKSMYRAGISMEDLDSDLINDPLFSNFLEEDHTRKSGWHRIQLE